ncbi:MAG: hypothetical protein AB3N64_06700 [Puniceicoccaceae bacterium]
MRRLKDSLRFRHLRLFVIACLVFASGTLTADVEVIDVRVEQGMVLVDLKPMGTEIAGLEVLYSEALQSWYEDFGATFSELGSNQFQARIPLEKVDGQFFQVVGLVLGTGLDPDNDGLPTAYEEDPETPATDPARFDTDWDGFNDGLEISLGTDPLNAEVFPTLADLPAVQFKESLSSFTEGDATTHTVTLEFDEFFTGNVAYSVSASSTAIAGEDYTALSGTILVNGTEATIDISIVDDLVIKDVRRLLIDLSAEPPPGSFYRRAGRASHTVLLFDNDAYWTGVAKDATSERLFRLRILRQSGQGSEIAFVVGSEDGMPELDGGQSSLSNGLVPDTPEGFWQATDVIDTAEQFRAVSPAMPVETSDFNGFSLINGAMRRILTLEADDSESDQAIGPGARILGTFTEEVFLDDPSKTYLNRTQSGTLVLIRDVPVMPFEESPFLSAQ